MSTSSGPAYMSHEIRYLFVDAAALRARVENIARRLFDAQPFRLDITRLAHDFTKTFYYDAVPLREREETEPSYETRGSPSCESMVHCSVFVARSS